MSASKYLPSALRRLIEKCLMVDVNQCYAFENVRLYHKEFLQNPSVAFAEPFDEDDMKYQIRV